MTKPNLHPPDFSSCLEQSQSPLFSTIPPEIRGEIFSFALADFEDTARPYQEHTYWMRPGYHAPRRSCTKLLRTCKRIYAEAWHLPFALSEHAFYLGHSDRAPRGSMERRKFQNYLYTIHRFHPKVEMGHLRIFPQLWKLEQTDAFQKILDMQHFHPRCVTVTIRYTDWWWWEDNHPLQIDATWVNKLRLPASVTKFSMDFESVERRKGEIDYIASKAAEKWHFRRADGVLLTHRKSDVSKWTGSSVLGVEQWVRDEARPGELDYHVVTVTWRPSRNLPGEKPSDVCFSLKIPSDFQRPSLPSIDPPSILVGEYDSGSYYDDYVDHSNGHSTENSVDQDDDDDDDEDEDEVRDDYDDEDEEGDAFEYECGFMGDDDGKEDEDGEGGERMKEKGEYEY